MRHILRMSGVPRFTIHDRGGVRLRYRIRVSGNYTRSGKMEYWSFRTKGEAEKARAVLLQNLRQKGMSAVVDSPHTIADAVTAKKLLEEAGLSLTLTEAVKRLLNTLFTPSGALGLGELFERYSEAKLEGWRKSSVNNFRNLSRLLLDRFGDCSVASLDPVGLEQWMGGRFPSAVYFNTAYTLYSAVFNWALKRDLVVVNPFAKMEKRRVRKKGVVDVFTVQEAAVLLKACRDYSDREGNPYFQRCREDGTAFPPEYLTDCRDLLPSIALALFAGLRPKEIERLHWEDVLLSHGEYGTIRVLPEKAKTGQLRNVDVTENLRSFLELVPREERKGRFVPVNYKRKLFLVRMAAGLQNRRDTARHSYASYWLAKWQDVNALRENMGHSTQDVLFAHYRTAVLREDAERYWAMGAADFLFD